MMCISVSDIFSLFDFIVVVVLLLLCFTDFFIIVNDI